LGISELKIANLAARDMNRLYKFEKGPPTFSTRSIRVISIKIYELQGHQVFNIYIMQFRGWDEDSSIVAQETALKMFSKAVP